MKIFPSSTSHFFTECFEIAKSVKTFSNPSATKPKKEKLSFFYQRHRTCWVTGIIAANVVLYSHHLVHYTIGEMIYLTALLILVISTVCVGSPSGDADYWSFLDDPILITVCTLSLVTFAASLIYTIFIPIPDPLPACSVHNWFLPTGKKFLSW